MNDHVEKAQGDKQDAVRRGMQIFERIEKGFEQLHDLWQAGCDAKMLTVNECHRLQNRTLALKYATLELHCDGTAVAQRNDCDVPAGAAGGIGTQGGPGR